MLSAARAAALPVVGIGVVAKACAAPLAGVSVKENPEPPLKDPPSVQDDDGEDGNVLAPQTPAVATLGVPVSAPPEAVTSRTVSRP